MPPEPIILCRGLSKTYGSGSAAITALHPIDLSIKAGESVALTGPSGSGKSTLLYVLGALESPTAGALGVDGTDLVSMTEAQAAEYRNRQVGFVFQFFNLVPSLNALDNVALPARLAGVSHQQARSRAAELLERVGMAPSQNARPETLSGGQQQRVALARALANRPRLLLADEPTGNLDTANGTLVLDLLRQLVAAEGMTLVMATHSDQACRIADRRIHLADGRLSPPGSEALDVV
jgi:putative ABC transport system ATP-binding protein